MSSSLVGVVPAAGHARRLGEPARSKELEPVFTDPDRGGDPRPVAYCLLTAMADAGIRTAFVVSSAPKADVRDRLGSGGGDVPALEHIVVEASPASAFTIAIGTEAAGDRPVALGFPDVLWTADRAFARLAAALEDGSRDVVLGLFPPAPDYATDGVVTDDAEAGDDMAIAVSGLEPADRAAGLPTWTLAVWRPTFSRLLEREVAMRYGPWAGDVRRDELSMSEVFALAIEAGQSIAGVRLSGRPFLDIGDPDRLAAARRACRPRLDTEASPPT